MKRATRHIHEVRGLLLQKHSIANDLLFLGLIDIHKVLPIKPASEILAQKAKRKNGRSEPHAQDTTFETTYANAWSSVTSAYESSSVMMLKSALGSAKNS